MDDANDLLRAITRRHFFRQSGFGIGVMALAEPARRAAAFAATADGPCTSRRRRRASSTCSWPARRRSSTCSTTSRSSAKHDGQPIPDEFVKGERFAFIKGTPKLLGSPLHVPALRAVGRGVLRAAAAPRGRSPTTSPSCARCTPRQFNHAPGADLHEHRATSSSAAPAWARGSPTASAARVEGPARLRRPALRARTSPGRRQVVLGQRLPAHGLPGRRVPLQGRPGPLPHEPAGRAARRPPRAPSTSLRELNEAPSPRTTGDPEIATRIAAYEMAYRMQTSVPELMDLSQGARRDPRAVRRRARQALVRQQLPARAPPGRARRALRAALPPRLGPPRHGQRRRHREPPARAVPRDRPGRRRPGQGPEAARPARRHARGLGRRVRPHPDERGAATTRSSWAATTTRTPSPCGWPAAASSPASPYGATDELGYNVVEDPVHVHDLHATILHLLGLDHTKLTYRFQGRDFRLTDVHGNVVTKLLA